MLIECVANMDLTLLMHLSPPVCSNQCRCLGRSLTRADFQLESPEIPFGKHKLIYCMTHCCSIRMNTDILYYSYWSCTQSRKAMVVFKHFTSVHPSIHLLMSTLFLLYTCKALRLYNWIALVFRNSQCVIFIFKIN